VIASARAQIPGVNEFELARVLEAGRQSANPTDAHLSDAKGFDLASAPLTDSTRLILVPRRFSDADANDIIAGSQSEYQHLIQRQRKVRLLGLAAVGLMAV